MFKELGQLAGLMSQLPKIKAEMDGLQQRLGQLIVEGDAGGGMVKVKVNGRMEVLACSISDEALKDRELLEDLVRGAVNQALQRVRQQAADETSKMAGNLGLPGFAGLPGFGA